MNAPLKSIIAIQPFIQHKYDHKQIPIISMSTTWCHKQAPYIRSILLTWPASLTSTWVSDLTRLQWDVGHEINWAKIPCFGAVLTWVKVVIYVAFLAIHIPRHMEWKVTSMRVLSFDVYFVVWTSIHTLLWAPEKRHIAWTMWTPTRSLKQETTYYHDLLYVDCILLPNLIVHIISNYTNIISGRNNIHFMNSVFIMVLSKAKLASGSYETIIVLVIIKTW